MRVVQQSVLFTGLVLVAVAMAGCAGGGASQAVTDEPKVEKESGLGSISGLVLDDEGQGIGAAAVALTTADIETVTGQNGSFVLNGVEPGKHNLYVQKLGFESYATSVSVGAGDVAELQIQLEPIMAAEPFHEVLQEEGRISCGVGTSVITVWVNCAAVTGNHQTTLTFLVNEGIQHTLSETVWESTTALSSQELLVNEWLDGDLRVDRYQSASPMIIEFDDYDDDVDDETEIVQGYFTGFGAGGLPVAVSVDQGFSAYYSMFYHQDMPEGWTGVDGSS